MVFFLVPPPPPLLVSFAKQLQVLFIDMQVEDVEYSKWSICKWSIGRLVIPRPVVGDRTTSNGGTKDRQLIVDFNTIQQQGVVLLMHIRAWTFSTLRHRAYCTAGLCSVATSLCIKQMLIKCTSQVSWCTGHEQLTLTPLSWISIHTHWTAPLHL